MLLQNKENKTENRYPWFILGFIAAILTAMFIVGCSQPLQADICEPGSQEWCPLYVKVVQ